MLNDEQEAWEREYFEKDEKNVTCFPYDLEVILPRKCPRCKEATEKLIDGMTHLFGGATIFEATGTWYDADNERVVKDENIVIEAAHSCLSEEQTQTFYNLLMECAFMAEQDAIALKQGKFYIKKTKGNVPRHLSLEPVTRRTSYGEARRNLINLER